MRPRLWRVFAVTIGVVLITFLLMDAAAGIFANAHAGFLGAPDRNAPGIIVVSTITDASAIDGARLRPGDRVRLVDLSVWNQLRFIESRPGDRFAFVGTSKDGRPLRFAVTMVRAPAPIAFWAGILTGFAFAVVGLVIAARRPADPLARMLVALLLSLDVLWISSVPWLPIWVAAVIFVAASFCQVYSAYAGLQLATAFPTESERGLRRWLAVINPWLAAASLIVLFAGITLTLVLLRPLPAWLLALEIASVLAYVAAIAAAFVISARTARGADLKRVQWVAWTLALGFSGSLIATIQIGTNIPFADWEYWISLTLLAVPLGLGYAIVRHRVVDIGFVVNRALVFGTLSAIVVAAFVALEWALSSFAVRVSHITSTSLELALALVLGFSLRSLHARVDRFVDDIFFRDRHEADRALRALARDVAYISDPYVAVARVHAELVARTGAAFAAIYVCDGALAVRIDPAEDEATNSVSIDDPALVRMRATRSRCDLPSVKSALNGDRAIPMLVRDAVTGAVVLGAKRNGEAYAPDELATIDALVLALGNALDALQTAALKAEVARVLAEGRGLDDLRRTIDPAAWARGNGTQPAGPVLGLGE